MNQIEEAKILSELLSTSRYKCGKSQEYMAIGLNVSKNTIYNWEKGTSSPTIRQFIQWYKLLELNPTPYIFKVCDPDMFYNLEYSNPEEELESALLNIISTMSIEQKQQLLYIILGEHGSNPTSVLQMITANMHCPMHNRVNIAQTIIDNYEIAEQRGNLIDKDNILPNMEELKKSTAAGKQAASKGLNSYH